MSLLVCAGAVVVQQAVALHIWWLVFCYKSKEGSKENINTDKGWSIIDDNADNQSIVELNINILCLSGTGITYWFPLLFAYHSIPRVAGLPHRL